MSPADGSPPISPPRLAFPRQPDFAEVASQLNRDMAASFEAIRPGYVPGELSARTRQAITVAPSKRVPE